MSRSKIFKEIHDTAKDLHSLGAIDFITMRHYDKLCFEDVHDLSGTQIKKLREKEHMSQAIFATLLNISISTIQKWEIGKKKPSGIALKLLNILQKKGVDAII